MAYKLKNSMLVPPIGFEYTQPKTGATLNGQSLHGTISKVVQHRVSNNLPRQEWDQVDEDVQQQICAQLNDTWCANMAADKWQFSMNFDTIIAGTRTLMAWVGTAASGQNPYVDQDEAERRAAICANCFANKRSGGCISCGLGNMIRALVAESANPGQTKQDDKLNSCIVCGCLLSKKVFVKGEILKKGISDKQREAYADVPKCWMNQL